MTTIWKNLSDPSWWFTAFFVAIIASLIAGFLQARVQRLFARTWDWYRDRKSANLAALDSLSDSLSEDPQYLSLTMHRMNTRLILWSLSMIIFLASPTALNTFLATPLGPSDSSHIFVRFAIYIFTIAIGTFSMWIGFKSSSSLDIVLAAYRKYRIKNRLPPIP